MATKTRLIFPSLLLALATMGSVDSAEDDRARRDPDRQRRYREEKERWLTGQAPKRVSQILPNVVHHSTSLPWQSLYSRTLCRHVSDVTEPLPSFPTGVGARKTRSLVFSYSGFQMVT